MRLWAFRAAVAALAVALGITLGAGPLQHSERDRDKELAAAKAAAARRQQQVAALESGARFAAGYAAATAPAVLRGVLAGRSVALVTLPGADPVVVARVKADVAAAQGRITGQVDFAATTAKASSRQLVEALTSQMVTQTHVPVPAGAGGYQRFGALLARAIGSGPTGQPAQAAYDATAVGIVSGLQTADLVSLGQRVAARAGLVLVVAGPAARTQAAAADNAVPVTILDALARGVPTVVLGAVAAAGPRGVVGALRANSSARAVVSTVDSGETAMGQVAAVLALAARAGGKIGHYGAVGSVDGVVPGASR